MRQLGVVVWTFVGRQRELDVIGCALADNRSRGFVVAGAAGVGKTSLVREFVAGLDGSRFVVRTVSATSRASGLAFGAMADYVADRAASVPNQSGLVSDLSARLAASAQGQRAVVVVDDAHLLDEASVAVLLHLARTGSAFVLAVVRSAATGVGALAPLWTDGLVTRMELPTLSKENTRQVLLNSLYGQVAALTVERLYALTGGNALLLRELVVSGLDSSALAPVNGVWTWQGPWLVSPRLSELVAARIGELDEPQRWALELVAIAEPVGVDIIAGLCGEDVLLDLERRGLLWTTQVGERASLRLAHPLYAEALRDGCPPLRTRRAKRELSEALAAAGTCRGDDQLQIARWRLDAEVPVDGELLVAAAGRAWSLLDLPLAERLARAALSDALAAGSYERAVSAGLILWRVLISGERHAELLELLDAIDPLSSHDPRSRMVGAVGKADTLFFGMGDYDGAVKALGEVEDLVGTDTVLTQEYTAVRALFDALTGRLADTRLAVDALDFTEIVHSDAAARFRTAAEIAATYAGAPETDEPVPDLEQMPWIGPTVNLLRVQRHLLFGRQAAASAVASAAHDAALRRGWDFEITLSSIANAQVARFAGRVTDAQNWMREACALHKPLSAIAKISHGLLIGEQAHVAAMAGEYEDVAAPRRDWTPGTVFSLWADLARPWVATARGAVREAREQIVAVAASARAAGAFTFEAVALHDAVRLGCRRTPLARLRELVAQLPAGHPVALYVRHAAAVDGDDADALAAVADEFEQLGWLPVANETYLLAARAYAEQGRTDSARRCRAFAGSVARRCPGLRPQPGADDEFGLTDREREVALLAVSGRTNRQIAEDLGVAKRTIDNHLARVYSRLGINTRDELRRFLS